MVTMRGGEAPLFSLFSIRRPIGDPERGRALLDKSIGMAWLFAGGPKPSTMNRAFVKKTEARIASGELKAKARMEKKERAEVAHNVAAKQKWERQVLKKNKGEWGFMDKLKKALGSSSKECVSAESSGKNQEEVLPTQEPVNNSLGGEAAVA
jgi:hypothetical protein